MNYPRVNLLRKSEQRYQGAVSRRFIMVSAVITPILLIAVLSGIKMVQYSNVQKELKANRVIWKDLEPKLKLFTEEHQSLNANRTILALFEGWKESELPFVVMLDQIQSAVPANVQFTRLSLKGEVSPGIYEKPEDMQLNYSLLIEGLSQGDRAEDDVWKFHRDLLGNDTVAHSFDTVDLADMRKQRSSAGISVREFRIVGSNTKGGKQ